MVKTLNDITNHFLKLAKMFSQELTHGLSYFKPLFYFIPILLIILVPSRLKKILLPHKQIKLIRKTLSCYKLQAVKFITCFNYKVFIESTVKFRNA